MDRKEFLSAIGLGAAAFAVVNCAACSKKNDASATGVTGPSGLDFTVSMR